MTFGAAQKILATAGVQIAPGMSDDEFLHVERCFGFTFPPDLRKFLATGLPVSRSWVDWRSGSESAIRERLNWPLDGICFDIKNNVFWLEEWGPRPATADAACDIARRAVAEAPILIPICSHRYIPAEPPESGNPVFSVYQADIVYYGADLMDYLQNEFSYYFARDVFTITKPPRRVRFWSRVAEENGEPAGS